MSDVSELAPPHLASHPNIVGASLLDLNAILVATLQFSALGDISWTHQKAPLSLRMKDWYWRSIPT